MVSVIEKGVGKQNLVHDGLPPPLSFPPTLLKYTTGRRPFHTSARPDLNPFLSAVCVNNVWFMALESRLQVFSRFATLLEHLSSTNQELL